MWFASVARYLSAMAIGLLLAQGALAQSPAVQSAAKLGTPGVAAVPRPQPDPGTLFAFAGDVGKVLQFTVVGSTVGTVWGDGIYTSDSVLATAAVHAGLLQPGQIGVVSVEVIAGLPAYDGATRNGVASLPYRSWDVAYRFTGAVAVDSGVTLPDPGDLSGYRGQDGVTLTFEVTGGADGAVWGDGIYTDDSRLAAAAVHAGVLQPGQTGPVQVEILPGQVAYEGAERNGVISGSYGSWAGSFRVVPLGLKATSKLSNLAGQ